MASPVEDLIDAINDDDAARVAELVDRRSRPGLRRVTATASRRSCCRATGSTARRPTPCWRRIPTSTSSRRRRSATSTGCASGWRRTTGGRPAYSTDGFTALHFAAFFGKVEAARTLLDAGAVVNAYSVNELQVQPLHSAAAGRHHEVCRVLIAAGADVNATQRHEFTPLHAAAKHGDAELVELFLSAGADPTGPDRSGRHPGRHRRGGRPRRRRASATRGRRRATGRIRPPVVGPQPRSR